LRRGVDTIKSLSSFRTILSPLLAKIMQKKTAAMIFAQPSASLRRRYEAGKRLRVRLPREDQAHWAPARDRPDPMVTLARVNQGRVEKLLAEKHRRMRLSAFSFFRGAAVLMASDLSTLPHTRISVQLCGDAHIRNLGAYAAPDGRLIFDINDFDETIPGPWEWDLKRLATSVMLAGEESGQPRWRCEEGVRTLVESYRLHLREFAAMPFAALARHLIIRSGDEPVLDDLFRDAERLTPRRNLDKLTVAKRGRFHFHDARPDIEHVPARTAAEVVNALKAYRDTLNASRRRTFERYRPADVAFKLVGTGSVGTRDYVVLLFGNGANDPLFMQVKQELPSCYESYLASSAPRAAHQGQRVADGQQMMQTASDPFLGYTGCGGHDYLVRQLADHKAGLRPTALKGRTLVAYARLCGEVLAKGHARTSDAAMLAGYVGASKKLDRAIAEFAVAYAEQTRTDYKLFVRSLRRGHGSGAQGTGASLPDPRTRLR
jgi:uncharacterized protein (DUF2252 family)